ncbi:hypothetical protein Adt_34998 [Abeliophyllum distichum]|uniref:Uncharacterized protein n=1 Tax=Abeliophyllum distichum TaxID=126358 RepID=A0ABD1QES6_9LAMI
MYIPPADLLDDEDLKWNISIHKDTAVCVICIQRVRGSTSHNDATTIPAHNLEDGLIGTDNVEVDTFEQQHFENLEQHNFQNYMGLDVEQQPTNPNNMKPKCSIPHPTNPTHLTQKQWNCLELFSLVGTGELEVKQFF